MMRNRVIVIIVTIGTLAALSQGSRLGYAQVPQIDTESNSVAELARELRETRRELALLQQRDAERQQWEASMMGRLAPVESLYRAASFSGNPYEGDSVCVGQMCSYHDGALGWQMGPVRVTPFGYAAAEMISGERSYVLLGAPLFLLPAVPAGIPDSRFTVSAQQTTLGFNMSGPDFGGFQSGANIAFNFFGDRPVQNNPGVFFLIGYVELKNESWRFWAGQDPDSLGRQNSNSPSWTAHRQSGNFGQIRPGFRAERFFQISDLAQTSVYVGLTQQVVLDLIANPLAAGTDNGWPNVELRWELGLGSMCEGTRPIVLALGGLVGETRAVDFAGRPLADVSTSWAIIPEARVELGCWGFQGEAFVGEALGTYNAGIGQSLHPALGVPIHTGGGFGEIFVKLTPSFTAAIGYGVDNPRDTDLAANQRSRNEAYWVNATWKMSEQWETRFEVSHQKTDYVAPSISSKAMLYHFLVRYNF